MSFPDENNCKVDLKRQPPWLVSGQQRKSLHSRLPKKTLKGLILPFHVIEKHQDLYVLEVWSKFLHVSYVWTAWDQIIKYIFNELASYKGKLWGLFFVRFWWVYYSPIFKSKNFEIYWFYRNGELHFCWTATAKMSIRFFAPFILPSVCICQQPS